MKKGIHYQLLILLCVFLVNTLFAQSRGSDSYQDNTTPLAGKVGERIQALLNAVNSNDPAVIQQFFEEAVADEFRNAFPMEEHVNAFRGTYNLTGGVDFYSVRSYNPPRPGITIIARDRYFGGWHGFTIQLSGDDQRIARLNISPARPPAGVNASAPLTDADMVRTLQEKLDNLCKKDAFSGTVLIARGDQVLFERACGEANKSFHIANNIDTKFNLGSMNKMFTATAVMQLVERGKVRLDDPISRYVDESWLPASITDQVTVQHLLTHTSGLGSYFNETYEKSSRDLFRRVDDYKTLVRGDTLEFEPGSRFGYSNTGMLLLGVVIEKASGTDYFTYIRENIYKPAGMKNTDCYELDRPNENLAEGYLRAPDGGWKNNLFMHVLKGGPAGGGYSTVRDLHRFARALQSGKLLTTASLEKMWKDYAGVGYGFGFGLEMTAAGKVVGHGGGFPGLNSNLDIFVDGGYIIAVMSNYDQGAEGIKRYIHSLLVNR